MSFCKHKGCNAGFNSSADREEHELICSHRSVNSSHKELLEIHKITQCIAEVEPIKESDTITVKAVKDMAIRLTRPSTLRDNLISKLHKQSVEGVDYTYMGLVDVINEVFGGEPLNQ